MTGEIRVEPAVVSAQVRALARLEETRFPYDPGSFGLWDKVQMPDEFQGQVSRSMRRSVQVMDQMIVYAAVMARLMTVRAVEAQRTEDEGVALLHRIVADLQAQRDAYARPVKGAVPEE